MASCISDLVVIASNLSRFDRRLRRPWFYSNGSIRGLPLDLLLLAEPVSLPIARSLLRMMIASQWKNRTRYLQILLVHWYFVNERVPACSIDSDL